MCLPIICSSFCCRYDALLQEKEELEEAFESFKQEMMLTQEGAASKEIRILKKVIKNLEVGEKKEGITHQSLFCCTKCRKNFSRSDLSIRKTQLREMKISNY